MDSKAIDGIGSGDSAANTAGSSPGIVIEMSPVPEGEGLDSLERSPPLDPNSMDSKAIDGIGSYDSAANTAGSSPDFEMRPVPEGEGLERAPPLDPNSMDSRATDGIGSGDSAANTAGFRAPPLDHSIDVSLGSAPKSTLVNLDNIVMAAVVVGIIVFASFQINQCVAAYANPATQTSVDDVPRTFPGIMLCPFSSNVYKSYSASICPKWSPQASLSFDFSTAPSGTSSPGCPTEITAQLINTNSDSRSRNQRSNSCPLNQINLIPAASSTLPALFFGYYRSLPAPCLTRFSKLVTVKNSAKPKTQLYETGGPYTCNSWTPPNVQCLVFDSSSFEDAASASPDLKSMCNPGG
jgi:hypothetical protein